MESRQNKIQNNQEFVYSCSFLLQIIYQAYAKNKISKEEKLKLKNYLLNKNKLIEEIKNQYTINQDNFVDWSIIRKKLEESDKPVEIIEKDYFAKDLKRLQNSIKIKSNSTKRSSNINRN